MRKSKSTVDEVAAYSNNSYQDFTAQDITCRDDGNRDTGAKSNATEKATYHFIWLDKDSTRQEEFLSLADRLYAPEYRMQNRAELKSLLENKHVLSKYFSLYPLLLLRDGCTVARCALSVYPGDRTAYLGFYESENSPEDAGRLFAEAESRAARLGCNKVVGPVNACFWLSYRMKLNRFADAPYFSEPYNLSYYPDLWRNSGYRMCDRYTSFIYLRPKKAYANKKYVDRLEEFENRGYEIRSPKASEWEATVRQVWKLIMELYADFPVFSPIAANDFAEHYGMLKHLLDFSITKIAFYRGVAVGFFLGIPDYGNLAAVDKPGLFQKLKVLRLRRRSKRYVMLYMGVLPKHRGLGKAIAQTIIERVKTTGADAIGAFIHEGKPTEKYIEDLVSDKYVYALFEKELKDF